MFLKVNGEKMLFSEFFKIKTNEKDDWFDLVLNWDTSLFIDPMLVFQNEIPDFKESKKKICDFFQEAFEKVALAKGKLGKPRDIALNMLRFKEPTETGLGYTNYGFQGRGMGPAFSREIFDAITDFLDWGLEEFGPYLSTFQMFVEGVGPDRVSDMITNIIKEDLLDYTIKVCKEKGIPSKRVLIENLGFKDGMWFRKKVDLPVHPYTGKPIILVPRDFLTARSNIELEDFESYISHIENEELRSQATHLFTSEIDRKKLIDAVRRDPETVKVVLRGYIRLREKEKLLGYDFLNDPNLLYLFKERLGKILSLLPKIKIEEQSKDSLNDFVEKVISQFKKCVENKEGYSLLFNDDDTPRGEKAAQAFFWGIADTLCKENNIDVSPESKTGRGPVDFKFSKGYTNKIIVEIKLAKSSQIYHGLEKQLLTYISSENVDLGFYVVIKQLGGDNVRVIRLEERYKKMKKEHQDKISIRIIDAYFETKTSASRV